jgi:hypothetical protein
LRAVSQTVADLADWGQSVFWAQRAAEQAPDDLLSAHLAQALVRAPKLRSQPPPEFGINTPAKQRLERWLAQTLKNR